MSLKDKQYDIISLRSSKRTYVYDSEDVKEAVVKKEKLTQNRINSIMNMSEKDFEITDNILGIKSWIVGILESEKQDNKEIFGDFKEWKLKIIYFFPPKTT